MQPGTRTYAALFALALACGILPAPASAQISTAPAAGDRIRVFIDSRSPEDDDLRPLVGTYLAGAADSLALRVHPAASPVRIPVRSIERIERSLGRSRTHSAWSNGWKTALFGAAYAATIHSVDPDGSPHDSMLDAGFEGLVMGAVIGAIVGAILPAERWETVRLQ